MRAAVEVISPHVAKEMLERMAGNRSFSAYTAERYARDMKDGRWHNNGQGIVIAEDGSLLDGQHRLRAVILSQVTVSMLVVRGADKASFITMDSGKPRNLSDVLSIEGYEYVNNLAGIARASFAYISGSAYMYNATKSQLEAFIRQHPYLVDCSRMVGGKKHIAPKAPLGAVLFLGNDKRLLNSEVESFVDGVIHGERLWKGDPRHTLREWLTGRRVVVGMTTPSATYFAAIARAWNAYAVGKELTSIRMLANPTRASLPIAGFDLALYGDVPDSTVIAETTRMINLAKGKSSQFSTKPAAEVAP